MNHYHHHCYCCHYYTSPCYFAVQYCFPLTTVWVVLSQLISQNSGTNKLLWVSYIRLDREQSDERVCYINFFLRYVHELEARTSMFWVSLSDVWRQRQQPCATSDTAVSHYIMPGSEVWRLADRRQSSSENVVSHIRRWCMTNQVKRRRRRLPAAAAFKHRNGILLHCWHLFLFKLYPCLTYLISFVLE